VISCVITDAIGFVNPDAIGFVIPDLIRDPCSANARRESPKDGPRVKPGVTNMARGDKYGQWANMVGASFVHKSHGSMKIRRVYWRLNLE
jgi:hypothetical protein